MLEGNELLVYEKDASIHLDFESIPSCETYLVLNNLVYQGIPLQRQNELAGKDSSSIRSLVDILLYSEPSSSGIAMEFGGNKKTFTILAPGDGQYCGRDNLAFNLGYQEQAIQGIDITLSSTGSYSFDSCEIVCQPVSPLVQHADELAIGGATSVRLLQDCIEAELSGEGLAVITVPYSLGWTAQVDGKPADVYQADVGFMAVRLYGDGAHSIELSYFTPWMKISLGISLVGLIVLCVMIWIPKLKK